MMLANVLLIMIFNFILLNMILVPRTTFAQSNSTLDELEITKLKKEIELINQQINDTSKDSQNELLKDIALIAIPTIGGAITSKYVVSAWQSQKEKNEIKRKILSQYDDHVPKTFTLLGIFVQNTRSQFNTDWNHQFPLRKSFPEEWKKFVEEYLQLSYAGNRFLRSLRFYYDDPELAKAYEKMIQQFADIFQTCQELVSVKNESDYQEKNKEFEEKLESIRISMRDFESILVRKDLIIR